MLSFFIYLCFALLLIVSILLLLVVLMQRPKQEGLGASFGSQMTDQAFGAQTSDVLKKATIFFGVLFGVLCFTLSILINAQFQSEKSSLANVAVELTEEQKKAAQDAELLRTVEALEATKPTTAPAEEPAPAAPAPAAPLEIPTPAAPAELPAPAAPAPVIPVEMPTPAAPAPAPAPVAPAPAV